MPTLKPHGRPKSARVWTKSTPGLRGSSRGRRPDVVFTQQRSVALDVEYLEQAVVEAVAAAEWYAARSPTAAAGFEAELDAAESAIRELLNAWPPYDHGTRRFLLRRYPFGIVYRVEASRVLIVAVAHGHRRPGYWRDRI